MPEINQETKGTEASDAYKGKRIVIDIDRCIDCRSCESACFYSHTSQQNLTHSVAQNIAEFPYHCRHCDEPVCLDACTRDAIERRDDGVVVRNKFRCIGCISCALACPFGAINQNIVRKVVSKCDLCISNLTDGDEPNCVSTCTSGALQFIPVDEIVGTEKWGARIMAKPGMHRI